MHLTTNLYLSKTVIIFFIVHLFTPLIHAQQSALKTDFEEKKVLVVYGGWEGHQPEKFSLKIAAWLKEHNAEVTVTTSTTVYSDEKALKEFDLIIQHITMSKLTNAESKGLLAAVKNGTGLAGCHGGLGDSFRNNTDYQYMVGGQFVKHPGGEVEHQVNIVPNGDPITQNISDFNLKTEQYYMHVDPNIKVLATTRFSDEHDEWIDSAVVPVVWKKYFGNGRVFFCSIGHSSDLFDIEEVWTLITRGTFWAAQGKTSPKEKWLTPVYASF